MAQVHYACGVNISRKLLSRRIPGGSITRPTLLDLSVVRPGHAGGVASTIFRSMCGIAGKVSARGPVPRHWSRRCARQVHRGPDSRGIHRSDGAWLGIQRLRVIDLETGDQPIYNEDRSVAVVLNGEIYNYRELRRDLERRGHRFRDQRRHRGDRPSLRGAGRRASSTT